MKKPLSLLLLLIAQLKEDGVRDDTIEIVRAEHGVGTPRDHFTLSLGTGRIK